MWCIRKILKYSFKMCTFKIKNMFFCHKIKFLESSKTAFSVAQFSVYI